jgi:hypothetical protein
MRIRSKLGPNGSSAGPRNRAAFTLVEVLIASVIFLMVIGSVLTANIFGIRMLQITQPKLSASVGARQTMNLLVAEITSAKTIGIGSGDLNSFAGTADGTLKQGNAIQLYPTTDTNVFIRYYGDSVRQVLSRTVSGATNGVVVAAGVVNTTVFTGEDSQRNILTNNQNNMVIGVTLQYSQVGGTNMAVGPSNYFKSYVLNTRITHRPR